MVIFYVRWRYYTMNSITFFHFLFIIISSVRSLLCCSTRMILFMLVLILRLRLIIQCIVLSTMIINWTWRFTKLPINFWFPFTKLLCLRRYNISANRWKSSTECRTYTNNSNIFILNMWFFPMLRNIFIRVWCIVKSIFFGVVVVWHP